MVETRTCPTCRSDDVHPDAFRCPHCRAWLRDKPPVWHRVVGALVAWLVLCIILYALL